MKIKKTLAGLSFVALMTVGGTVFAAGPMEHKTVNQEDSMTMSKKDCMEMCEDMDGQMDCCEMMKNGKMKMKDCKEMMKSNMDCC